MIVEQVDFVAIPTRDPERAIAFYRDVIGLPQSAYAENEFEAGNVTLAIWAPEAHGYDFGNSLTLHRRYAARKEGHGSD